MKKEKMVTKNKLLQALDSVTTYNQLAEYCLNIKDKIKEFKLDKRTCFTKEDIGFKFDSEFAEDQFEVLWIIIIELFGDYGTSPRSGWIYMENSDKLIKFINDITKTERLEMKMYRMNGGVK